MKIKFLIYPAIIVASVLGSFGIYSQIANATAVDFTTPGTYSWTVPAGVSQISVEAWGAGGSGGGATRFGGYSGGGGGGGYAQKNITVSPGQIYSIVVGGGGAGKAFNGNVIGISGDAGGASSFGGTVVANGGSGGEPGCDTGSVSYPCGPANARGAGGTATGGDINTTGGQGALNTPGRTSGTSPLYGGSSPNGGAGGRAWVSTGQFPGNSYFESGFPPGGGGAGAPDRNNGVSGNGAPGAVKITYSDSFDFSIDDGGDLSTLPGRYITNQINLSLTAGTGENVGLSVTSVRNSSNSEVLNQPNGLSVDPNAFSPVSVTPTGNSILTLGVYGTTPPGIYTVTVRGLSAGASPVEHSTTFTVTVTPYDAPTNVGASSFCSGQSSGVLVSWTPAVSSGDPVIGQKVYQRNTSTNPEVITTHTFTNNTSNSYMFTNLAVGNYVYGVSALYAGGESAVVSSDIVIGVTSTSCGGGGGGSCTGAVPANSDRCVNTDPPSNTPVNLVNQCSTPSQYCEYVCRSGYTKNGNVCEQDSPPPSASCAPYRTSTNAPILPGQRVNVGTSVTWKSTPSSAASYYWAYNGSDLPSSAIDQQNMTIVYNTVGTKTATVTIVPSVGDSPQTVACTPSSINVTRSSIEEI